MNRSGKIKIAVTVPRVLREGRDALAGVSEAYLNALIAAGAIPHLVPFNTPLHAVPEIIAYSDGILFPGGDDVLPEHYGEKPHPKLGSTDAVLDLLEISLAREAFEANIATLGICRGVQVMNVALGGTLYQDLPSQLPEAHFHQKSAPPSERGKAQHPIALADGSLLRTLIGHASIEANSFHHQAVKDPAATLLPVAHAPDGVIEGLEAPGKEFFVGVQCHPECLWSGSVPLWKELFVQFVTKAGCCRKSLK